ncbi:hypothetical protein PYCC9005_002821 [Savitreella phatthalungensis]
MSVSANDRAYQPQLHAQQQQQEGTINVLGPVIRTGSSEATASRKDSSPGSESGNNTIVDEGGVMNHPQSLDDNQLDELRRTLSKRSVGGDPLDLEHNFSLERYVRELLHRQDAQQIGRRAAGVCWKNVSTFGVGAGLSYQANISDPLFAPFRIKEIINSSLHPPKKTIISNFNGVVRDGEMLLVLGKPGAGCSTLLKSLAGEHNGYTGVEGDIHYHGISQKTMLGQYRGEIVYNGEVDVHFPHLNVSQTLQFAAEARLPHARVDRIPRKDYTARVRDVLATTFGLRHTYNTKVGNDYVRGVSGGERKRVSIAETLASRAQIQFWDNSTRGLDASTALEYAKALRVSTNLARSTCVVCIYQAGEQLYEVFDKVTVVYSGKQIYFGPTESAKQYFVDMGFDCPKRQTTADFLTAITDPKARFAREGFADQVPRTPEEFEERWRNSSDYQDMMREIEAYNNEFANGETEKTYRETLDAEKAKRAGKKGPYVISYPMQLRLCSKRAWQRITGDPVMIGSSTIGAIVQALIVGSVFWKFV